MQTMRHGGVDSSSHELQRNMTKPPVTAVFRVFPAIQEKARTHHRAHEIACDISCALWAAFKYRHPRTVIQIPQGAGLRHGRRRCFMRVGEGACAKPAPYWSWRTTILLPPRAMRRRPIGPDTTFVVPGPRWNSGGRMVRCETGFPLSATVAPYASSNSVVVSNAAPQSSHCQV